MKSFVTHSIRKSELPDYSNNLDCMFSINGKQFHLQNFDNIDYFENNEEDISEGEYPVIHNTEFSFNPNIYTTRKRILEGAQSWFFAKKTVWFTLDEGSPLLNETKPPKRFSIQSYFPSLTWEQKEKRMELYDDTKVEKKPDSKVGMVIGNKLKYATNKVEIMERQRNFANSFEKWLIDSNVLETIVTTNIMEFSGFDISVFQLLKIALFIHSKKKPKSVKEFQSFDTENAIIMNSSAFNNEMSEVFTIYKFRKVVKNLIPILRKFGFKITYKSRILRSDKFCLSHKINTDEGRVLMISDLVFKGNLYLSNNDDYLKRLNKKIFSKSCNYDSKYGKQTLYLGVAAMAAGFAYVAATQANGIKQKSGT